MMTLENLSKVNWKKLFKLLIRDYYYDYVNLFTRRQLAEYISSNSLKSDLEILNHLLKSSEIKKDHAKLNEWMEQIDYRLLPKRIITGERNNVSNNSETSESSESSFCIDEESNRRNFISNLRTAEEYVLKDVHYFAHIPVPLLLMSMLWTVTVGVLLENEMEANCLGNRLDLSQGDDILSNNFAAFNYYLPEYNRWRDQAIDISLRNLKAGNDVLLIALDIKQCFYNLRISWEKINEKINSANLSEETRKKFIRINEWLKDIHIKYHQVSSKSLIITHHEGESIQGIPIGLPSSKILANYELLKLDRKINSRLNPIYYGRYVDDILIVLNNPSLNGVGVSSTGILQKYFVDSDIIENSLPVNEVGGEQKKKAYKIKEYDHLYIQQEKLIFHYYDHQSSWAGLKNFKKDLVTQASEFRFLPQEDLNVEITNAAYDIQYEGSINKLRSIIGVKENSIKLSHHLYSRMLRYWLGNEKLKQSDIDQLQRFYRGSNIFNYCRTWERVFTLLVCTGGEDECTDFYEEILKTIHRLRWRVEGEGDELTARIIRDAEEYLIIALSHALALVSFSQMEELAKSIKVDTLSDNEKGNLAKYLRISKLIRHQFVGWPLLEYTSTKGSLVRISYDGLSVLFTNQGEEVCFPDDISIARSIQEEAPRFIHLDEIILYKILRGLYAGEIYSPKFEKLYQKELEQFTQKIKVSPLTDEYKDINIHTFCLNHEKKSKRKKEFCIGIANVQVDPEDCAASYEPCKQPNLSFKRQTRFFNLLNSAIMEPKCDLVVLPEVCVPFAWLPFMVKQARRKDIGLVFGLEHWPVSIMHETNEGLKPKKTVYNFAATILPFRSGKNYHNCIVSLRNKNHFAPDEAMILSSLDYILPSEILIGKYKNAYDLFYWRDCAFSVYNCFELSDVEHRGLFRSKIDLLVSIAWNKDINYYSNILEAVARDVHCYIVHANTSQYGDSRIIAPKPTEKMDLVQVKGGINDVLLKGKIDINKLREYQAHKYLTSDTSFKPVPAGFDHKEARRRCKK